MRDLGCNKQRIHCFGDLGVVPRKLGIIKQGDKVLCLRRYTYSRLRGLENKEQRRQTLSIVGVAPYNLNLDNRIPTSRGDVVLVTLRLCAHTQSTEIWNLSSKRDEVLIP